MGRPRKASVTIESVEQCGQVLSRLLIVTTEREAQIAERDAQIALVYSAYAPEIYLLGHQIGDMEAQLQAYYMSHLEQIEKDGRKSLALAEGTMGRRSTPKALKLMNKAWTWGDAKVKLRSIFGAAYFTTPEPEIDKDKVKADLDEEQLAECGLKAEAGEKFYIELARPEPPDKSPEVQT